MHIKDLDRAVISTCILGVLVSTYAFHVEMTVAIHPEYRAMCDIGKYASCSKVLTSEYSKGFGLIPDESSLKVPNCIYGIIFYCLMIFLNRRCFVQSTDESYLKAFKINISRFIRIVRYSTGYYENIPREMQNKSGDPTQTYKKVMDSTTNILGTFNHNWIVRLQFFSAVTSLCSSVYFAYLLAFVLYDLCIVCVSTYIINSFLVYFTWKKTKSIALKIK